MTLDEKISQLRETERKLRISAGVLPTNDFEAEARNRKKQVADENGKLADWLEELKRYKDLDKRDESKEIKGKTMLQDFLEKHPKAVVNPSDKLPTMLCPFRLGYTNSYCKDVGTDCVKCWNRPMEEE